MELKRLPFLVALVALALALAVELGKGGDFGRDAALRGAALTESALAVKATELRGLLAGASDQGIDVHDVGNGIKQQRKRGELDRPGKGIPSLAILDGLLFFVVTLLGVALLVPERIYGRLQGIVTLIVSFLTLIGAIFLALGAIALVFVMIGLLLAPPFGTIAYLAIWGSFRVGAAEATLGVVLLLKIAFGVCLLLAQPRFLQNKGLLLLVLTSLLANVVVSFLIGFPPRILASITDVIGAIIVAVLAAIWAIVFLVGSIVSIVKVLRVTRVSASSTAG